MTQWHIKSATKVSGSPRRTLRRSDKRLAWKGGEPSHTTIAISDDKIERITVRGMGNTRKVKTRLDRHVHAFDHAAKKARKLELISVIENNADPQFARRNIITKGAVVEATDGKEKHFVKITSRPGQSGNIMGVVLKDFKRKKDILKEEGRKEKKKAQKPSKKQETPDKGKI